VTGSRFRGRRSRNSALALEEAVSGGKFSDIVDGSRHDYDRLAAGDVHRLDPPANAIGSSAPARSGR
jgi:hypothetical protein